jgi:uncharacterized protein
MDPIDILSGFYGRRSKAFEILVAHGELVALKAIKAAERVPHLKPDIDFIENAAMLHDIGILDTDSPGLGCNGKQPYICHGILGCKMLEIIGMPEYGLVCERHVGLGISADDVRQFKLPGVLISALETYLYRFETINGRAFVSGAFQRAHLDTLMQVPAGRGC